MKSHAQAVVIGGGVVGCSVLYHLSKLGWKDVVLVERSELTSGSTWHAAGGMHTINSDANLSSLQSYTIKLYQQLEQETGESCGIHRVGCLYLAASKDRFDYLKSERAKARYLGIESELVSLDEVRDINPLVDTSHFVGALFDPNDGHLDPNGVTQAYAKAARQNGAEIYRNCPAVELKQAADRTWSVVTAQGTIKADIVVNAAGLWAREVAALAGVFLPILPMEHQYIVTNDIDEVKSLPREMPMTIDFDGESYSRQEGQGILIGTYEKGCRHWAVNGTPADFGHELLESDLDRMAESLSVALERIPCLKEGGVKRIINGGMVFAPDGNPLIGPVRGRKNFFVACGVMAGFSQGGGVGRAVAEWIVDGEPSVDVFAMDVARFGEYANKRYTLVKTRENYTRRFALTFPNEELPAARPWKTTPVYDQLKNKGAVFGAVFGTEYPLWFAPDGTEAVETPTFRRSNAFAPVGEECQAVRNGVGLLEISTYAKYEVTGEKAGEWLDYLLTNRVPVEDGRTVLAPMLSPKGKVTGDFTVTRRNDGRYFLIGSGLAEAYHLRWFKHYLPDNGVQVHSLTSRLTGFAIAGPRSRELLASLCDADVSNQTFPFLHAREMQVGPTKALVLRISFTGELGYEIYIPPEYQIAMFETLLKAGKPFDPRLVGMRALNSMRLEKSYGSWGREFTPDFTPFEADLMSFVRLNKPDFIGREATLQNRDKTPNYRRTTLVVDVEDTDAVGDEPVFYQGNVVGRVTSAGYGHRVGKSIALAYVLSEAAQAEDGFEVEILGEWRPAQSVREPLYDPAGARLRS